MNDTRIPAASPSAPTPALAALSAGAAAIHFGVMPGHFSASLAHGVFFAFVGWAQLAWAAAALTGRGAGQNVLLTGAFFNLAVLVIWLVGTTAGLPFGPGAWTPQPAQAPDLLCATLELMLIAGSLVLAERRTPPGTVPSEPLPSGALPSGAPPSGTGPAEDEPAHAGPFPAVLSWPVLSWVGRPWVRRLSVATLSGLVAVGVAASFTPSIAASVSTALAESASSTSPADPRLGHHHHGTAAAAPDAQNAGDQNTGAQNTGAQAAVANALLEVTRREATKRWPTARDAEKDGYESWTEGEGVRQLAKPALLDDGAALDPARPEALVYYEKPDGSSTLLGVVYIMPPGLPGPAVAGPLTPWQPYPVPCPASSCTGPQGMSDMLRVWLVDYPGGPFADATGAGLKSAIDQLTTS
ncbi:hypothetical protein [Sphaerimonospora thailandensis]|uniref:Uncharacterized protein n=1 Tax=Sphaerimonospora thailandensis TaxID=795644 RepID=A0A8J3R466_9ACTN|nr:hypothetical protein [Sphaerimonospora thailandensis]GIH68797.1 hypothetical protein Mth01_10500 [Sphaerimonospora thailandensis]